MLELQIVVTNQRGQKNRPKKVSCNTNTINVYDNTHQDLVNKINNVS